MSDPWIPTFRSTGTLDWDIPLLYKGLTLKLSVLRTLDMSNTNMTAAGGPFESMDTPVPLALIVIAVAFPIMFTGACLYLCIKHHRRRQVAATFEAKRRQSLLAPSAYARASPDDHV